MKEKGYLQTYYGRSGIKEYDGSEDCSVYQIENTDLVEFCEYLRAIQEDGFELYAENRIRDNYFYTYFGKNTELHAYFTAHDRRARIIADRKTKLFPREKEICPRNTDTVLFQFELDYRKIDCGMCYIIQTCEGNFFIIDSAHMFSENDHERIYDFLKKRKKGNGPIVISGWYLTHAHQDHIVKFMDFIRAGYQDVILENIYYNFPECGIPGSECWKEADKETMHEFHDFMEKHTELRKIRVHTGQRFFIGNLTFTVLSTHEDLIDDPLECYNNASSVLLMEAEGSRVLFLGDANVLPCEEMTARYGKELKADIVQVAHHGFNDANAGIYCMVRADTALYPTDRMSLEKHTDSESNQMIRKMQKEIFLAGDGTAAFLLPYQTGRAIVYPCEINMEE